MVEESWNYRRQRRVSPVQPSVYPLHAIGNHAPAKEGGERPGRESGENVTIVPVPWVRPAAQVRAWDQKRDGLGWTVQGGARLLIAVTVGYFTFS